MVLGFNVGGTQVLFDVLAFLFCVGVMAGALVLKMNEPIVANPVRMVRKVAGLFVSMLVVAAYVCLVSGNDLILGVIRSLTVGAQYPWAVFVLFLGVPVAYMAVRRMRLAHGKKIAPRKAATPKMVMLDILPAGIVIIGLLCTYSLFDYACHCIRISYWGPGQLLQYCHDSWWWFRIFRF